MKPQLGSIKVLDPAVAGKYAGVRWEIVALKQVNATGHPVDANGVKIPGARRMNARFALWVDPVTDASAGSDQLGGTSSQDLPPLPIGSFVVKSATAASWVSASDADVFVVLADRVDIVKLVRAGGDTAGRYWPSVPRAWVTPVELDLIIKTSEEDK